MSELNYLREVTGNLDGPVCKCGAIMVHVNSLERGEYYLCRSCGTTTGCSELRGEAIVSIEVKRKRRSRRTWCYVQRPKQYEMAPCDCGNADTDWSEWRDHLWCAKCKKDFIPKHTGIFDGPVPVHTSELLGIYFDRIDLKTDKLLPDFQGKSHFKLPNRRAKTR